MKYINDRQDELCECGHEKAFHFDSFNCVYGMKINTKGIRMGAGCVCNKFIPQEKSEGEKDG